MMGGYLFRSEQQKKQCDIAQSFTFLKLLEKGMLYKKDLSHSAQVGNFTGRWVHLVKGLAQKNITKPLPIVQMNFHFPYRNEEVNNLCYRENYKNESSRSSSIKGASKCLKDRLYLASWNLL